MISRASLLAVLGMLAVTYSTRLIGFFAFRNRVLSARAKRVMTAARTCAT